MARLPSDYPAAPPRSGSNAYTTNNTNGTLSRSTTTTKSQQSFSTFQILVIFVVCVASFYAGLLSGMHTGLSQEACVTTAAATISRRNDATENEAKIESIVQQQVEAELSKAGSKLMSSDASRSRLFPDTMSSFATGMTRVLKDEFAATFDYGNPMEKGKDTNEAELLMLYSTPNAIPTQYQTSAIYGDAKDNDYPPLLSAKEATENCEAMNVVITNNPGNIRQCLAIVGNYESYHVQRWLRVDPHKGGPVNSSFPLRPVSRAYTNTGEQYFLPPTNHIIKKHWNMLRTYLNSVDAVLEKLKPVAEKVAIDNTIIVMTCNRGQSELLMNFACSARARGLELHNVLVFPTDEETKDLAEGLGLMTFYDENNFEKLPSREARGYGDSNFVAMMFAKVVCVQLISMLGYDLLFQDVDIVWYKNPLEFFQNKSSPYHEFDIYFQDDGARSVRYAPLSVNSGFYYARNNAKTQYLFTALLYSGDVIQQTRSHQQVLVALLNEHSSLYGLRVKVVDRDMHEFPCGFHFNRRKDFMKSLMKGEIAPYIFHMSWTLNKDSKLFFFRQMGEWFLNDNCIGRTKMEVLGNDEDAAKSDLSLVEPCCFLEPKLSCHYSDKPSKDTECKNSPMLIKGGRSFW